MRTPFPRPARLAPVAGVALALGACGDGEFDDPVPVGGGAGDAAENAAVLRDYASAWELGDLRADGSGDMAFLVIAPPDEDGESAATLEVLDGPEGCWDTAVGGTGTVSVDPNGFGVFMNGVLDFEQALLTLSDDGGTLGIEHGPSTARTTTEGARNDGLVDFQPRC